MSGDATVAERLAEARRAKEERAQRAQEADDLRELLVLDLDARFEAELGRRGQAFDIVEFRQLDKVVALKTAPSIVVKRFDDSQKKKTGSDASDALAYVLPQLLHPTKEEFKTWHETHVSIVWECVACLRKLEGLRAAEVASKP